MQLKARRSDLAPVDLFLAYYARPKGGHTVTAGPNKLWTERDWTATGGGKIRAMLGSAPITLDEIAISHKTGVRRLVWFTYWSGGSVTDNPLLVRLFTARAALGGGGGQAMIAISAPLNDSVDAVRSRLKASFAQLGPVVESLPAIERGDSQEKPGIKSLN
jgi:EpsI family protein